MRATYRVDRLRASTRVFGLLGPHAESAGLSEYHAWFARDDFDGVAVPFVTASSAPDAAATVSAYRELPVHGWHVHGPQLQLDVIHVLDELAPAAARQGKVNGIIRRADAALVGHWVESPREQYALWLDSAG
jgi:shikimate 5-dehydrogenase